MTTARKVALNAVIAALYAAIALILPATALANYRVATALYVLAAWNPTLVPGLALGNALAGIPQGPLDILMGAAVGLITTWSCSKIGRWAPAAVLIIPTLLVPLWLSWIFGAPYWTVVPVVAQGQALSALLGWGLMKAPQFRRVVSGRP